MPVSTKTGKSRASSGTVKKAPRKSQAKAPKTKGKRARSEEEFSSGNDDESDAYKEESKEESESEPESLDSDDLDGEEPATKKRKRAAAKSSPRKRATPKGGKRQELEDDEEFDEEVGDGVEIVGKVVKAPTTGRGEFHFHTTRSPRHQHGSCYSSSGADKPKYAGFSQTAYQSQMQRSGMVQIAWYVDTVS